jgi:hypothetical protein
MTDTRKTENHTGEAGSGGASTTETTTTETSTSNAAAMKDGKKPGPKDAPVQVRNAGEQAQADKPADWDEQDDAVDESFPASDSAAKY